MSEGGPEVRRSQPEGPGSLRAGKALLIFAAWLGGQLVGGFLGAVSGLVYLASRGIQIEHTDQIEGHVAELMTPALAAGTLAGAAAMIVVTLYFARGEIRHTEPTAIGWSRGPWKPLLTAALFGLVISAMFVLTITILDPDIPDSELGPVARLAEQSERVRWIWAFIAIAIAPVTEEFLFRGVLFSGLSRSWGIPAAAVTVSALFFTFHLAETLAFWPAAVAIGILTIGTIAARLLTNRLGPPIAMHLSYNSVLAIALVSGA